MLGAGCWWLNTIAPVMLTEQQWKVRHYKSGRNALSSLNYVLQSPGCNPKEPPLKMWRGGLNFYSTCFLLLLIEWIIVLYYRVPLNAGLSLSLCEVDRNFLCSTQSKQNIQSLPWHVTPKLGWHSGTCRNGLPIAPHIKSALIQEKNNHSV